MDRTSGAYRRWSSTRTGSMTFWMNGDAPRAVSASRTWLVTVCDSFRVGGNWRPSPPGGTRACFSAGGQGWRAEGRAGAGERARRGPGMVRLAAAAERPGVLGVLHQRRAGVVEKLVLAGLGQLTLGLAGVVGLAGGDVVLADEQPRAADLDRAVSDHALQPLGDDPVDLLLLGDLGRRLEPGRGQALADHAVDPLLLGLGDRCGGCRRGGLGSRGGLADTGGLESLGDQPLLALLLGLLHGRRDAGSLEGFGDEPLLALLLSLGRGRGRLGGRRGGRAGCGGCRGGGRGAPALGGGCLRGHGSLRSVGSFPR